jgi:RNA polymerase sigma-70 factor (ECF subfamily)
MSSMAADDNIIPLTTTDEQIVEGVLVGSTDAQRELVRRYGRLMASVILNILGPRNDLDDILQEAYLIAFRDIAKLDDPAALKSWLASVAVSRARNTLRGENRKWWLVFRPPKRLPQTSTVPEHDEAVRAVYEAMERMKPDSRTVFALRYVMQMTVSEVADVLDVSHSTAKRRVSSARATFDKLIEGDPRLSEWCNGGRA